MQNLSFTQDDTFSSLTNEQRDVVQAQINMINASADIIVPLTDWRSRFKKIWSNYRWRMRHYFYIHLGLFFMNSLLSGLITWAIEDQNIPFIDCWFMGATCVFTCGLQTYDFGSFSQASQIILLLFTLVSGITVSTIPAIFIKIFQAKRKSNTTEDTSSTRMDDNNILPVQSLARQTSVDPVLRKRLQSLPDPYHLRITAYIILIVLIISTCLFIYLITFFSVGFWFKYNYILQHHSRINATVNPFYASLVVTITSFNQNGLTCWQNGASIFVDDIFMNIIIMIAVMSGTSLFPAILRGVVNLIKFVAPWRYKIYLDYILLNNHRLSAVIFPSIQTRLYVTSTILMQILGVTVALILDYNNLILSIYTGGKRFMIFMFLTVNTRFAGYSTIDLSKLTEATLIIFVLLMFVKPQMLCTINETPFEMEWILLQTQQTLENNISTDTRRASVKMFLPIDRMKHYLLRQGLRTKAEAEKYFAEMVRANQVEAAINEFAEKRYHHRLSIVANVPSDFIENYQYHTTSVGHLSLLRMKLLLIIFCRHAIVSLFSLIISTRTWLFIFVFLICAFEASLLTPSCPNVTVFRVIFEVISAFGGCGLSMGYSSSVPNLASAFTVPSKIILIFSMCMGRHRGLLDSMKDQEEIEYSAQTLIQSWRHLAMYEQQQQQKKKVKNRKQISTIPDNFSPLTSYISTRF
ncbi:unnamed protein product [Rotaria socialis]|uniref:Uncharacterized protein n=1 Tax=Rotaria socialis TaxID=392032 RepID=A0A820D6J6_9BILA|nr:unnamed protein product [Rotaria socialis]CAF4219689.1 unnamed protein product [Rotaria socialis]